MAELAVREPGSARLEAELAEVCGVLNAATGRLVVLVAEVLATGSWQVAAMRSPEQWVGWKCGLSPGRARALVAIAARINDLPTVQTAIVAGEISEDQVAVICRHAPAGIDAEVAELARTTTVAQLRRALSRYVFDEPVAEEPSVEVPPAVPAETRRVSFGFTDGGSWRLTAELPADEGHWWRGPSPVPVTSSSVPASTTRGRTRRRPMCLGPTPWWP